MPWAKQFDPDRALLEAGRASGEVPAGIESEASALLGLFVGLRVLARRRPAAPLLHAVADRAAAMLA